jgi:hypothetical protein
MICPRRKLRPHARRVMRLNTESHDQVKNDNADNDGESEFHGLIVPTRDCLSIYWQQFFAGKEVFRRLIA